MRAYTGLRKINIILIGGAGAGKTAFISTVASICCNHIKQYKEKNGSPIWLKWLFRPKLIQPFDFKTDEGKETAFRIFDTVGWGLGGPDHQQLQKFIAGPPKHHISDVVNIKDRMHSNCLRCFFPCCKEQGISGGAQGSDELCISIRYGFQPNAAPLRGNGATAGPLSFWHTWDAVKDNRS